MRVTKKMLREAVKDLSHRVNQVCQMSSREALEAEVTRCIQALGVKPEELARETDGELIRNLLLLAIQDTFHDHWMN